MQVALETVRAAKRAGADAIKLQTYTAKTMTIDCKNDFFMIKQDTAWDGEYLYDLYKRAYTPWEWHKDIYDLAKEEGLICFSSPFDNSAVDLLEELNSPIYKIASLEITDLNLIKCVARKNKPIILSTGVSNYNEIKKAINVIRKFHNKIILLHCVSGYPTPIDEINLSRIKLLKEKFKINFVGLSDHTSSYETCLGSIFYGACIIEKHFSLSKKTLDGELVNYLKVDEGAL